MQEIPKYSSSRRHQLLDNIASLFILQGLNYVIPIAVLPYLVRVLGMETYGLLAFAQSFAQYFTIFTDYGFNFSATRSLAQKQQDPLSSSRLFSSVSVLKLLLGLIGFLILVGVVTFISRFHEQAAFFYVGYLAVIGNILFPVWYYQGIQQMRYISLVSGSTRVLGAALLFVFVHRPQDALLALSIQSGAVLVSGIAGMIIVLLRFRVRLITPSIEDMRLALVDGWHLFVSTAAISLYTNTNVFLVGILAGNLEAGYFSAAEKVIRAMNGLITPIAQAIYPHVNALVVESRVAALRFARKTLSYMLPAVLLPSVTILLFAAQVSHLCFGQNATGSASVLRWIALLPVIVAVSNVLGIQTMVPFGLDKQFSRILILAGIMNVLIAVPMIIFRGAEGAGISVLITEAVVTVSMIFSLEQRGLSIFHPERAL